MTRNTLLLNFLFICSLFTGCGSKTTVSENEVPVTADTSGAGFVVGEFLFINKASHSKKLPGTSENFTIVSLLEKMHENEFAGQNFVNGAWRVIKVDGSCESCREVGDTTFYNKKLRIKINSLGFVRARKDASCFEVSVCDENIIGNAPDDITVYGHGPLKNADFSAGIAYAVIVEDTSGKRCRGYLSYTVLEEGVLSE